MNRLPNKLLSKITFSMILLQILIFAFIYLQARTTFLWFWATFSFIPAAIICVFETRKGYVVLSLSLLFISQQAIFIFANPNWGFSFSSDAINDFHTASVMSETAHFELGHLGYTNRLSYSYYPMMHLYSLILSEVSNLPLAFVALYIIPLLNPLLTTFSLYHLNHDLFGLEDLARNVATLLFEMGFYYTAFQSQFIRETFAFPLVLLSFWVLVRIAKGKNRAYAPIALILIITVILSHQISSYLFFLILALMALSFIVFHHNNRLNSFLFLTIVFLGAYTSFVALSFSATEWMSAFEGIQAILYREGSHTILKSSSSLMVYLSLTYYAVLGACILVGGIKLLREKKKDLALLTILAFFTLAFAISVLLRLSTSADPWSWTYYMGLRGTIWAFLGISVVATAAIVYIFKLGKVTRKNFIALLVLVCILAVGKFSQYPPLITDSSNTPVTYPRYVAALWLKGETIHGSNMLVAPYQLDVNAFEASRDMAPYAFLKEYFIEELKGRVYDGFRGYIPFVGDYFDQYKNETDVHIIYSNGEVQIGYKPR